MRTLVGELQLCGQAQTTIVPNESRSLDTPIAGPPRRSQGRRVFSRFRDRLAHAVRQPMFWAALLLMLLPFVLFWPVWWPAAHARQSFAYGDFVEQFYPMRAFVAGEWRQLRLPLWDPYTYSGTPAAAASLYAAYYPFNLWLALFPHPAPFLALEIEAIFHLGLAGVFTLLFVRQLTGSTSAGLLAGAAFSLGGFLTSYPVLQLGILETAAWLPLGLWLLELGLARRDLRRVALAGLVFGCALLAGHPQTFLYIAYLAASYFVFRAWRLKVSWRFALGAATLLGAIVAGSSALQWLPSLQLARLSPRAALSYAEVSNGFALPELWGLLRPQPGQWSPLYVGLLPLALAAWGLISSLLPGQRKRSQAASKVGQEKPGGPSADVWFWAAVAGVAVLLSLGGNGFLYPVAHDVLPGFGAFRNQERAAFLVSFALSVLAGYGWIALLHARSWRRTTAMAGLALLLALTFADLYRANHGLVLAPAPPDGYFPSTPIVKHLQSTGSSDWRTSTEGLLPGDGNAGLVYHLRDVSGNSPLHLTAYDQFLAQVPELRFWQLLNVQHLLTQRRLDHGALAPVMSEDDLHLYQVFVDARPAWVAHDVRLAADASDALAATADPALDPLAVAVVETAPDPPPQPAVGPETVQLVQFEPQRVVIEADLSAPGVLVSSEVAYPGWVARVDGRRAPTLAAFGLLRAVALPAGHSRVEWRFEPLTARAGLALSAVTLAAVVWLLARRRRTMKG